MRKPLPRPDKSFTAVPNDFFDVWMREVEPSEWKILCFIIKKTIGWNKQEDWIAMSQFINGTGLTKNTLLTHLESLVKKDMIFRRYHGPEGMERVYYKLNIEPANELPQDTLDLGGAKIELGEGQDPVQSLIEPSAKIAPTKYNIQKTRSKDSAAPGGSDTKGFIDYFFEQYKAKFGVKYHVNGGKEGSIAKALLKKMTLEELKKRVDVFLSTQDAFYEKAGYTIGCFSSQINKLNLKIAGKTKSSLLQRERNGEYAIPVKSLT